jgi:YidC/Oxa1 family membrane protein insertase
VLDPISTILAKTITFWHELLSLTGLPEASGVTWALAIALLVVTVRIVLLPLTMKQIRSQRAMQELQPKIKELQKKHKGDRETLNAELMKLYKERGVNPLAGCLPLLLQAPIFFALFQTLRGLGPKLVDGALVFPEKFGVPEATAEQLGRAKLFGAPIAAGFNSSADLIRALNTTPITVKVVCGVFIAAMAITQFVTTKQMMAKSSANMDPAQATQQKVLLYLLPPMFALFGFSVALGVLLYWTTTNLWSMGQQYWVIKHMPQPAAGESRTPAARAGNKKAANRAGDKPAKGEGKPSARANGSANGVTEAVVERDPATGETELVRPTRPQPNRNRKKSKARKGGRR